MHKTIATLGILALGLALTLGTGCGGDEREEAAAAMDQAETKMGEMADAVAKCRELAAQSNWAAALEPCGKALELKPDDLALKHAFQQAQAAAAQQ